MTDRKVLVGDNAGNCTQTWEEGSVTFLIELEKLMTKYEINHACVKLDLLQKYVKELGGSE